MAVAVMVVVVVVVVVVRNRVDWPQTAMNLPSNCTGSVCNVEYVCEVLVIVSVVIPFSSVKEYALTCCGVPF